MYRHFNHSRRTLKHKELSRKIELPYWLQLLGAIGGIITGALSIYIGFISISLQRQANSLASNDTLQRAQINTLTRAVAELRALNKQSLDLNSQVVDLVREARNQSKISLLSDEPQMGLVSVFSRLESPEQAEEDVYPREDAYYKQNIVLKNYGRRLAIAKALYVYFFNIQQFPIGKEESSYNDNRFHEYLDIRGGSTGLIDPTINNREIAPGDTLEYSLSVYFNWYYMASDLRDSYEVVKLIYQDPLGRDKEKKFYFQNDSNSGTFPTIPKSVEAALDSLTRKPPASGIGVIRPTR